MRGGTLTRSLALERFVGLLHVVRKCIWNNERRRPRMHPVISNGTRQEPQCLTAASSPIHPRGRERQMKQRRMCYAAPHLRCDRTRTSPFGNLCDVPTVVGHAAHIEAPHVEADFSATEHTTVDRARVRHFISFDVGLEIVAASRTFRARVLAGLLQGSGSSPHLRHAA